MQLNSCSRCECATALSASDNKSYPRRSARLLKATGAGAEADQLYHRALAMDEKSFGPNHRKVGGDLNPLTELLIADERYAEAKPLSKRAQ
jgi:hypothetical protein